MGELRLLAFDTQELTPASDWQRSTAACLPCLLTQGVEKAFSIRAGSVCKTAGLPVCRSLLLLQSSPEWVAGWCCRLCTGLGRATAGCLHTCPHRHYGTSGLQLSPGPAFERQSTQFGSTSGQTGMHLGAHRPVHPASCVLMLSRAGLPRHHRDIAGCRHKHPQLNIPVIASASITTGHVCSRCCHCSPQRCDIILQAAIAATERQTAACCLLAQALHAGACCVWRLGLQQHQLQQQVGFAAAAARLLAVTQTLKLGSLQTETLCSGVTSRLHPAKVRVCRTYWAWMSHISCMPHACCSQTCRHNLPARWLT